MWVTTRTVSGDPGILLGMNFLLVLTVISRNLTKMSTFIEDLLHGSAINNQHAWTLFMDVICEVLSVQLHASDESVLEKAKGRVK